MEETPSLRELCKHLLPELAPNWEPFCIAADLDEDGTILGIIEKECRGDSEACCRMLFRKWMKSGKRPTWGRVIECLKEAKCGQLANKVEKQIRQIQSVREEETDQSLPTTIQVEQPPKTKNTQAHSPPCLQPQGIAAELVSQQSPSTTSSAVAMATNTAVTTPAKPFAQPAHAVYPQTPTASEHAPQQTAPQQTATQQTAPPVIDATPKPADTSLFSSPDHGLGQSAYLHTDRIATQISPSSSTSAKPVMQWTSPIATTPTKDDITSSEPKPISLLPPSEGGIREYQRELARPGLNGENYIICAPTGSGKTLVAAMIISEHLKKGQEMGEERKVLFMVKTQQLAHQQKDQLEKYVGGARIAKVLGETGGEQMLVAPLLSTMDLIVCTAGKIRNELQNKSVMIGQFSLIVVDECHHTVGSDQYSEVLEFYLMEKFGGKDRLPQVIGLTASPGAGRGRSPTLLKAISHQLDLCAHLDAVCGIKMVTDNMDELGRHTKQPDHILRELQSRSSSEAFIDRIIQAMKRLEDFIKGGSPYKRNSLQYRKWVEVEKEAAELRRSPNERDRISALEHLGQYYHALITYEDFTSDDAIEVLKETEYFPDQQATPVEQSLVANHDSLLLELSKLPPVSNPLLEGVERILVDQFTSKPASKAIFFVREIRHTRYVQRWVESRPILRDVIRVSSIVGYTRAGMSKEQQLEAIRGFRSGKYNLLVSTSVLEEGIDVAACNLVIRFQIMTNEIAEVQAQGRARALESKMYTIMSSQSEKQCLQLINEEKKQLALKAPSFVTELCTTPKFRQKQETILAEREARERANTQRKLLWKPEEVDVVCKKCKTIACKGSDIYCFETHYVVPDPKFRQTKMDRRPHHETFNFANMHSPYKIFCRNCNQDWGNWSWWASQCVEYPVLKCKSFTFHHRGEVLSGKQWKKVQFEIKPLPADFDNDKPDPADLTDTS